MNTNCRFGTALLGALLGISASSAGAATLPSGFVETRLAYNLAQPSAMEIAPDGRVFFLESKTGKVRIVKNGLLLENPFVTIVVNSDNERGLLGVAFDPSFATNQYVYFCYTATPPEVAAPRTRVVRYTASGDVALEASKTVILDLSDAADGGYHNGGALHFGSDGKLYIATGDNTRPANSQEVGNRFGKILRINKDGTIPSDNPTTFQGRNGATIGPATGVNRAIWAIGLRNPFTFAVQPGTGRIFINDVGQNTTEEINEGVAGVNYGWRGGTSDDPAVCAEYTCPLFSYSHGTGVTNGNCIAGGAFYNPATTQFPSGYTSDYFFADFVNDWINVRDSVTGSVSNFATGIPGAVDLDVAPDGSLYYLSYGVTDQNQISHSGALYKVQYTGAQAPWISIQPVDTIGSVGHPVTFSVTASGQTPLSYQWRRGGTNISGATSSTYTIPSLQATDNGAVFSCRVSTPTLGSLLSSNAVLTVTDNQPPVALVTRPLNNAPYSAGSTVSFGGSGTDPETGTLPADAFSWEVSFCHGAPADFHAHPFQTFTGVKSGTFVIPNTDEHATNVWYRITLSLTDPDDPDPAFAGQDFVDILPQLSTITLASTPSGLQVTMDETTYTTPATVTSVEGMIHPLTTAATQTLGGATYQFVSWSDSGAITHNITTPVNNTTYRANFTVASSSPPEANVLQGTVGIPDGGTSNFGGADVASTTVTGSVTLTYTLQNTGSSALSVGTVGITGTNASDFSVTTLPATSVAGGGSTTFAVKFDPSAAGARTASLSFATGDSDENPYNFTLRGSGDIVVDNDDPSGITQNGAWTQSAATGGSYDGNYLHDGGGTSKPLKSVRFTPTLPAAGAYEVFARWTSGSNRSNNVQVDVISAGGTTTVPVNQQANNGTWMPLGTYTFATTGGSVLLRNDNTNGSYVIADAVKFVQTSTTLTLECENLVTTASGATEADFPDTNCSGGYGNKLSADGATDYVQYEVDIPSTGVWNISLKVKKYNSRGKFRLFLPQTGDYVGVEQDQFAGSASYPTLSLGSYNFTTAGTKQFRFVVTGKNSLNISAYSDLGNDAIILSK